MMMIGDSAPMAELARFIALVAPTNSTVLIEGESGTGKELVAQSLHRQSRRSGRRLVAVNCAALPENLLESELFGYESGAFTGAVRAKKGKFELATGGTLFLDEIGELGLPLQAKLLRALQERAVDRIGGVEPIAVDVRVSAATNRDLKTAVTAGEFREDLYYRLKVLTVRTPPLRERRKDILALAWHFASKHGRELGRAVQGISSRAESILTEYDWPGNVRQLENVIERAIVLGASDVLLPGDLPEDLFDEAPRSPDRDMGTYHEVLHRTKRRLFETAFHRADGDYNEAAALLGLHPKCIHRLLKNLQLTHLLK